jgi:hypothetical protein
MKSFRRNLSDSEYIIRKTEIFQNTIFDKESFGTESFIKIPDLVKIFSKRFFLKDSILKDCSFSKNIFLTIPSERFNSERFRFWSKSRF